MLVRQGDAMDAEDFAVEARRFCEFVDTAHTLDFEPRVREGRRRLAAVVALGCALPAGAAVRNAVKIARAADPESWPGFGSFQAYTHTLDPFDLSADSADLGTGDLSDDFLCIYRDLRDGLSELEQNGADSALWSWRQSFDSHWGTPAVSALRMVHEAVWRLRG
jgi:hypothetical protein